MTKQTRQRQLAQLRARREAEKRAARRRRAQITYGSLAVVVVVVAVAATLIIRGGDDPAATPAAPTTPAPLDARADAPGAPAAVACGGSIPPRKPKPTFDKAPPKTAKAGGRYELVFKTSCGSFTMKLDAKAAPATVSSMLFLAGKGVYDSTWFHHIVPGGPQNIGVIQGGDPKGDGTGDAGYELPDELPKGKDPYKKYTVAMANSGPNTSSSQFFVNTQDNPTAALASNYTMIGTVTAGRGVVDQIAKVPVGGERGDTPTQAVWVEKVTVKTS
jgi:peptidyl-prolyl cis-trans isomerase B (cyclophilin B)